jgi:gliding motility-associated-like protein
MLFYINFIAFGIFFSKLVLAKLKTMNLKITLSSKFKQTFNASISKISLLAMLLSFSISSSYAQCNEIYVTPTGSGAGTMADPTDLLTGLGMASSGDRVLMAIGTYNIDNPIVTVSSGVVVEGGFDDGSGWSKTSATGATTILRSDLNPEGVAPNQRLTAMSLSGVSNFRLQDITLQVVDVPVAASIGTSTYGLYLNACSNYDIVRCQIIAGDARDGSNGTNGANGVSGSNGSGGQPGNNDSQASGGGGGNGGNGGGASNAGSGGACCSTTAFNGGAGGAPSGRNGGGGGGGASGGGEDRDGGTGGSGGGPAGGGGSAGQESGCNGSVNCGSSESGNDASNGVAGSNGTNGTSASGSHSGGFWVITSASGSNGTDGGGGSGGGGGGGGAGEGGTFCIDGHGSGGGGGGGGGQGGAAGTAGTSGGSSFGVYLFSNGAGGNFVNCSIQNGTAGAAGLGGSGGSGGSGGFGGAGNTYTGTEVGCGGDGGNGGAGGSGGDGGDGAAGTSVQVYVNGTAPTVADYSFNLSGLPVITWDNVICAHNTVNFTAGASGSWDFSTDASPATTTGSNVTTEYLTVGRFTVEYNGSFYQDFVYMTTLSPDSSNAGPDQDLCNTTTTGTLAGNVPARGTGTWTSLGSATVDFPAANNSTVSGLVLGDNEFVWTIDNGPCCPVVRDTVNLRIVQQPSASVAGIDSTVCGVTSLQLYANTPAIGTGTWSVVSGAGVFTDPNDPATTVTSMAVGVNEFAWTISNGTCPTEVDNIQVTVSNGHTLPGSINISNNNFCVGGTVDLDIVGNGGVLAPGGDWTWYEGSCGVGAPIGTGMTVTGLTPSATTDYFVRAEGGSCATSLCVSVTVTVDQNPTVANAGPDLDVCGTTATLAANSPSIGTGVWSTVSGTGSADTPGANNSGVSGLTLGGTTVMEWTVTNGSCPASTDQVSIDASDVPSTSNAGTDQVLCDMTTATLGANTPAVGSGTWTVTAGSATVTTPTDPNSGVTGLTAGVNTFVWTISNGTCPTEVSSVDITSNQSSTDPTNAYASNPNLCVGGSTQLNVTGSVLGTNGYYEWHEGSLAGPVLGTGPIVSTPPLTASTDYYVVAVDDCGTSNPLVVSVTVGTGAADPDSATVSMNNICPEDTVTLTVWSATPLPTGYTYVWYTGACGAVPVGVGQTLDVAPSATETYYVRAVGTCGQSLCADVTVTVLPGSVSPTGITTDNNNFCIGGSATLTVNGGSLEAGAVWTWYENACGGGTAIGTGSSITVTPNTATTYYVRGEGGTCGNTMCATININVHGAQVYLVPFDTVCVEGNTAFALTGGLPVGGAYTGTAVAGGVFDASAAGVGSHAITYTYTDGFGCANSATENIIVVDANTAATSITADNSVVCNSGSANLTVNGGNLVTGADWYWYENSCGGGAAIGNGTTISVSPTQTTTYFVRAEGGNDYCGPTECVAITISVSNPEASLLPFDAVCGSNLVTLSEGIPSGGTYSGTGVTGNTFDAGAAGVGTHTITYTYTDGNGCSATATGDITVNSGSISLVTEIETQTCANGGVLVHAIATGGNGFYIYNWSDGSTDNPHMWTEPGTYTVTVSDGSGCSASVDSIEVAEDLACLELANTFTPNSDGTNDTWNLDFTSYSSAALEIYSKWGVLVYQTDGLTIQWDGNDMNGNALPAGTYYYIVELDGGSKTQNGPISIVR